MSVSRKLAGTRTVLGLAVSGLVSALILAGCSGSSSTSTAGGGTPAGVAPLAVQTGEQSFLFYGDVDRTKLGSIRSAKVFDPKVNGSASNPPINVEGTTGAGVTGTFAAASGAMPKPSTLVSGYNSADNSYTDLYVNALHYVQGGNPYKVSMWKQSSGTVPSALAHSTAVGLSNPVYQEIDYLGTNVFLSGTVTSGGITSKVLIFPKATDISTPMPFTNKTLLTIAYDSYGAPGNGIIAYDSALNEFDHCVPSIDECPACGVGAAASCTKIANGPTTTTGTAPAVANYKFLGDVGGTSKSMLLIDGQLYILDKNTAGGTQAMTLTMVPFIPANATLPAAGTKSFAFNNDSAYFADWNSTTSTGTKNITRLKSDGTVIQVNSDGKATGVKAFTDQWVIYGDGDFSLYAAKKDGSTTAPVELAVVTQTTGYRAYGSNMAFGNKHLYTTYKLDTASGKMTYQACIFDGSGSHTVHDMTTHTDTVYPGGFTCRANGFWGALTAAKKGTLNFNASFPYSPYALLRVDVTDEDGGGTLVAVDPTTPLGEGTVMGAVPNYSFDTLNQSYYYRTKMVDSDGYVVIYGKDDLNVKGDAFLVNLNQANSLVNLTNDTPAGAEISAFTNALHCHGRTCQTCHSFAAGKIFANKTSTEHLAYDHNIRFLFKNGTTKMARRGKGKGENFNLPLKDIVDSFTAEVVQVDASGAVVAVSNKSNPFSHGGKEFANCDLCHHKAPPASVTTIFSNLPGTISVAP